MNELNEGWVKVINAVDKSQFGRITITFQNGLPVSYEIAEKVLLLKEKRTLADTRDNQ